MREGQGVKVEVERGCEMGEGWNKGDGIRERGVKWLTGGSEGLNK